MNNIALELPVLLHCFQNVSSHFFEIERCDFVALASAEPVQLAFNYIKDAALHAGLPSEGQERSGVCRQVEVDCGSFPN